MLGSIRKTIPLAGALPVVIGILLVGGIAFYQGQATVESLSVRLREEVSSRITEELSGHLELVLKIAEQNAHSIRTGRLNPEDQASWLDPLLSQLQLIETVSYIGFGDENGDFVAIQRNFPKPGDTVFHSSHAHDKPGCLDRYVNESGQLGEMAIIEKGYDPRQREWYRGALEARETRWSPMYASYSRGTQAITLGSPLFDDAGQPLGVSAVNMSFHSFSEFLKSLDFSKNGEAFVVERDGTVVATSSGGDLFSKEKKRFRAVDLESSLVRQTSLFIHSELGGFDEIKSEIMETIVIGGEKYLIHLLPYSHASGLDWVIGVVIPEKDLMARVHMAWRSTLLLGALMLLLSVWLSIRITKRIVKPIMILNRAAQSVKADAFDASFLEKIATRRDEFGHLAVTFTDMVETITRREKDLRETHDAVQRFVPSEFLSLLERESIRDIERGDHTSMNMEVLFCDMRSFTTIIESMSTHEAFEFINHYLGHMEPSIYDHGGFINQYLGDCIMALFPSSADAAVLSAIQMLEALERFNQTRLERNPEYIQTHVGIGINTGLLMIGTIGGLDRLDSGVIGDSVNIAARVEGLTGIYGATLLLGESTYQSLREPSLYDIREIDRVILAGKREPITIYEVLAGLSDEEANGKRKTLDSYSDALVLYRNGEFKEARDKFADCYHVCLQDLPARLMAARCAEWASDGGPPNWSGVIRLTK